MENIEFIAAKDLPTTEAEEVDVLCVEGGELKRKPGASLGGKPEYDLVVKFTVQYVEEYDDYKLMPELLSGSYEAVAAKINENKPSVALIIIDETDNNLYSYKSLVEDYLTLWWEVDDTDTRIECVSNMSDPFFNLRPDNTFMDW